MTVQGCHCLLTGTESVPFKKMTNITAKNTKAEILEASEECLDYYSTQNEQLRTACYFLIAMAGLGFMF